MRRLAFGIALIVGMAGTVCPAAAQRIPARLDDSTFWRMMNEYSEPWGTFRSENFVSNETSLQWVIPQLQKAIQPGGVYLGVAPDQNFTYYHVGDRAVSGHPAGAVRQRHVRQEPCRDQGSAHPGASLRVERQ